MIPQPLKFLLWKTMNAQREIESVAQELCGIQMQGDALVSCPTWRGLALFSSAPTGVHLSRH